MNSADLPTVPWRFPSKVEQLEHHQSGAREEVGFMFQTFMRPVEACGHTCMNMENRLLLPFSFLKTTQMQTPDTEGIYWFHYKCSYAFEVLSIACLIRFAKETKLSPSASETCSKNATVPP